MQETNETDVRSIQCTACGAPLELNGGHRIRSLSCGYCGSVMDAHDGYNVVKKYKNAGDRPLSPFKLGMQGKIKAVLFTLVGMVEYDCEGERWLDFQLYSPTHGYAWLSQQQGHYIFSRRIRDLPHPPQIKRFTRHRQVKIKQRRLQTYDAYEAKISYVEGELTWIAKRNDKSKLVDAIDPPYGLSYERTRKEVEYSWEEYLDNAELSAAFSLEPPLPQPSRINPLQPYPEQNMIQTWSRASVNPFWWLALFTFCLWLIFDGDVSISRWQVDGKTPFSEKFTLNHPSLLIKLDYKAEPKPNSHRYDVVIMSETDKKVVFSLGQQLATQYKDINAKSWSSNTAVATVWFKLPTAGDYRLKMLPAQPMNPKQKLPAIEVSLTQGIIFQRYFIYLLLFLGMLGFAGSYHRSRFEAKRWQAVEDD